MGDFVLLLIGLKICTLEKEYIFADLELISPEIVN